MLRILIVEDEVLTARNLEEWLVQYGATIVDNVKTGEDAIRIFNKERPDFVLIDIVLKGSITGIAVASHINKHGRVPFVFLTEHFTSASPYFKPANATKPSNYIPKDLFSAKQLWHFVEVAFDNYIKKTNLADDATGNSCLIQGEFFIRDRGNMRKVMLDEILYVKSARTYCEIYLKDNNFPFRIRGSLKGLLKTIPMNPFVQVHGSYAANKKHVILRNNLGIKLINDTMLPVGKTFRRTVSRYFPLLKQG